LFAVCDLNAAQAILGPDGIPFVMAPSARIEGHWPEDSTVYAEILARYGFGELPALRAAVAGWRHLFALYRPDAMVADHSPLSLFAGHVAGVPTLHLAMGFEHPPEVNGTLPVLREWLRPDAAKTAELEQQLLGYMNVVALENSAAPFNKLSDLYNCEVPLLATLPEIDHFPGRADNARYIGPLYAFGDGPSETWPGGTSPKVFVYLRPDANIGRILEMLTTLGCRVVAVIPGLDGRVQSMYRSDTCRIHTAPIRLRGLADQADCILIHSGHGMAAFALLASIPLLMIPQNLEQVILTQRIQQLGAGVGMLPDQVPQKFEEAFRALLGEARFRQAAHAFAKKYRTVDQEKIVQRLANTVERLPGAVRKQLASDSDERGSQQLQ
jgi:UDP:flavonoid glycosyltransferase YjiC (YdhE family)